MAEQVRPIRRKVALKVIKPGMDSNAVIARFEAERQALAMMDHPNIARVLDGGTTDTGRPYFVMELVKGVPLTEYCDANKLPMKERLELFTTICHAVQHAHQKGIIHRDLKPSNILVTLHDGKPVIKVIDFGVSKALNQRLTEKTLFTAFGQMVGTPQYMSPEQAEMSGLDVDTRSDVFSLGVILYEMLTGSTPLDPKRLRNTAYAELQRIIKEEQPPRPSHRISTMGKQSSVVAANRQTDPKILRGALRSELDWVVMKAIEKDRNRRYETAQGFAADIRKYLNSEQVGACPPSSSYRMKKALCRYRGVLAIATLILITLLAGLAGTTWKWIDEWKAKQEAEYARRDERLARARAEDALSVSRRKQAEAEAARDNRSRSLYAAEMNNAFAAWYDHDYFFVEAMLEKYKARSYRGWEHDYLARQFRKIDDPELVACESDPLRIELSADEKWLIQGHALGKSLFTLVNLDTKETFPYGKGDAGVFHFAYAHFSHDSKSWVHPNNDFSSLIIRNVLGGEITHTMELPAPYDKPDVYISAARFAPDDQSLALIIEKIGVFRYDLATKEVVQLSEPADEYNSHFDRFEDLQFSSHGGMLAVTSLPPRILSYPDGKPITFAKTVGSKQITSLEFIENDSRLAYCSADGMVRVIDSSSGDEVGTYGPLAGEARQLAYCPVTNRLAVCSRARIAKILDASTLEEKDEILGCYALYALDFNSSGGVLYGSYDSKVRLRAAGRTGSLARVSTGGYATGLTFSTCGKYLVCLVNEEAASNPEQGQQVVKYLRLQGQEDWMSFPNAAPRTTSVACAEIGERSVLAIGTKGPAQLRLMDLETSEEWGRVITIDDKLEVSALCAIPHTTTIVCGLSDGKLIKVDIETRRVSLLAERHKSSVTEIKVLNDGRLVTGATDGCVCVWRGGELDFERFEPGRWIRGLDVYEDQFAYSLFGAPNKDLNHILVVDAGTQAARGFYGHKNSVHGVFFIDGARELVTLGGDRTIRFWDTKNFEQRAMIRENEILSQLAISPDESTIAAGSREGSVFIYRR